jgi:hypothetical protein
MNLAQASKKTTVVIAFMIATLITITIVPTQLAISISRGCPPGQTCLLPSNPLNSNEGKKSIQSRGQDQTTGFSQGKKVRQDDNNNNTDDNGGQIRKAPVATSGNNIYIAWWTNKTGNDELMFRASTDGGKTFGDKINLSNSTKSDSQDAQIDTFGDNDSNVIVTWWERNATSNEPLLRTSTDKGATFGPISKLSANETIGSS